MNFIIKIFIIVLLFTTFLILGGINYISNVTKKIDKQVIINNLSNNNNSIPNSFESVYGLDLLNSFPHDMILDIRYASKNNFTKKVLYDADVCVLRGETLKKLLNAQNEFLSLGYKLKIWDAYRPFYVQKILWDIVPDSNFIANPHTGGSNHNRGCAVDVTLTDLNGNELDMPTGFDEFSDRAYRSYAYATEAQIKNSELLKNVMLKHGFKSIYTEWWHFDDINYSNYPVMNIGLNEYLQIIDKKMKGGESK